MQYVIDFLTAIDVFFAQIMSMFNATVYKLAEIIGTLIGWTLCLACWTVGLACILVFLNIMLHIIL